MALKQFFTVQAEIPQAFRDHYAEHDGRWVLQTDPPTEDVTGLKTALDSERRLKREADAALATWKTKYEGIDPEDVASLRARVESFKDKESYDKDGLDVLIRTRTQQLREDHQRAIGAKDREIGQLKETTASLAQESRQFRIRTGLLDAVSQAGVAKQAIPDAVQRGMGVFTDLDEHGNLLAKNGDDVRYGKDGVKPLQPDEWILSLKADAPHLWPPSSGGGASVHRGGAGNGIDYAAITSPTERLTAYRQAQRGGRGT